MRAGLVLTTGLLVAASCTSQVWDPQFEPGEGPAVRTRQVPMARATHSEGELAINFTGGEEGDIFEEPCKTDYELDFDESVTPPHATIWQIEPSVKPVPIGLPDDRQFVCTAVGHPREFRLSMSEPPSHIVDGARGDLVQVIVRTEMLAPTQLPAGWRIEDIGAPPEPMSRTTRLTDGEAVIFLRSTLSAAPENELDRFREGTPQTPRVPSVDGQPDTSVVPLPTFPFERTVEAILIRNGIEALVEVTPEQHRLRFAEGGFLYELSTSSDVSTNTIIAMAESLT